MIGVVCCEQCTTCWLVRLNIVCSHIEIACVMCRGIRSSTTSSPALCVHPLICFHYLHTFFHMHIVSFHLHMSFHRYVHVTSTVIPTKNVSFHIDSLRSLRSSQYARILWCQTSGYLPNCRASLPLHQYQIQLLGDRGRSAWVACCTRQRSGWELIAWAPHH